MAIRVGVVGVVCVALSLWRADGVEGVTQMCNPPESKIVYQFSVDACPFGILFSEPLRALCLRSSSDNDMTTFYADVCQNIKYDPDTSTQIQLITTLTDGPLSEMDSCMGNQTFQCDGAELKEVNGTEITEPGQDAIFMDEENFDEPEDIATLRNDSAILDQTVRMFKFLVGLEGEGKNVGNEVDSEKDDEMSGNATTVEGPILRVTQLLTQSFQVLSKHCNVSYVPAEFSRDVRRMFLFLLREGTFGELEDVSREDYQQIKQALDHCMEKDPPFLLQGPACETHANAKYFEKNGTTIPYTLDEFAYIPYKYEVVIDATWGVTDFTHGLCFGTFRENVNYHHLYQRAMERLFNEPIVYRWARPPHLNSDEFWNHMLSANARQTMRNLDVCIQAAYLDTPFVHRLERPLIKFEGGPTPAPGEETGGGGGGDAAPPPVPPPAARRRRQTKAYIDLAKSSSEYMGDNSNSISDNGTPDDGNSTDGVRNKPVMLNSTAIFSLEQIGLSESGWCFQTEAEQRLGVLNYIRTTCPGSPASHQFSQLPSNSTGEAGDEAGEARPWDYKDEEGDQDVESSSQSSQNPGSESSADGGVTNTEPPPTTPATEE